MRFNLPAIGGLAVAALVSAALFTGCADTGTPTGTETDGGEAPATGAGGGSPSAFTLDGGRLLKGADLDAALARTGGAPAPETAGPATAPLAKTAAALPSCNVNFNSSVGLGRMPDQAYTTFSSPPHYTQLCNSSYNVLSEPVNVAHYHLSPERPFCYSNNYGKMLYREGGGTCINETDAKWFPRFLQNHGGSTGAMFFVRTAQYVRKNFDLQNIWLKSGTVKLLANRVGVGWVTWTINTPGRYSWSAGVTVSELRVLHGSENGVFSMDDLVIAIHP